MSSQQKNRSRTKMVAIRMNDQEYASFQNKLKESGLSQQQFILQSIFDTKFAIPNTSSSQNEIAPLICTLFNTLSRLENISNQQEKIASSIGDLSSITEIHKLQNILRFVRKENQKLWQS